MTKEIIPSPQSPLIPPPTAPKDLRHRMTKYLTWVGHYWLTPNLNAYHDFLRGEGLQPTSIAAHLSTVRAAYRDLMRDRDLFYDQARAVSQATDPVTLKTIVDEMVIRIKNAIEPEAVKVDDKTIQDIPDAQSRRLTATEADELLRLPGLDTLLGKRDTAMIAVLLCTGIREGELVALAVGDLHHMLEGEPAILVSRGKGNKQRVIPYGDLIFCRDLTDRWLTAAGITAGPIFRAFWKGHKKVRPYALTTSGVEVILRRYPFLIGGELDYARPHDLRRTYARLLYEAGVELVAIKQNLGHAKLETTLLYIGPLDTKKRRPPQVFEFDFS